MVTATRLLSPAKLDAEAIGEGGAAFLCRSTGFEEVEALEAALEEAYAATAGRIDAALCTGEDR